MNYVEINIANDKLNATVEIGARMENGRIVAICPFVDVRIRMDGEWVCVSDYDILRQFAYEHWCGLEAQYPVDEDVAEVPS